MKAIIEKKVIKKYMNALELIVKTSFLKFLMKKDFSPNEDFNLTMVFVTQSASCSEADCAPIRHNRLNQWYAPTRSNPPTPSTNATAG